ncbi:MAG: hypothetical protein KBC53_08815 [Nitrosomonas sp.]|nr:hypothetical protein [Nitrosomonas sp.]
MNINIGDKVLVTTDNWFFAPDGLQYRSVFGTFKAIRTDQDTLGIKTNIRGANWYAEIGNMTIAGCQIHYAIKTDNCELGSVNDSDVVNGETKEFVRVSRIYNAD